MNVRLVCIFVFLSASAFSQSYKESTFANFPPYHDGPTNPQGGLIIDSSGNLYGSAVEGGPKGDGALFEVSPSGAITVLYNFEGGTDGAFPTAGVARDSSGNLYGTTSYGGTSEDGVVFKITPQGTETVLYNFPGMQYGTFGVTLDSADNVYGYSYGSNSSNGLLYEISKKGVYSVLYNFCSLKDCTDGDVPSGNPTIDKAGNLYGTTTFGGESNNGAVFKLTPKKKYSVLYSFNGVDDAGGPEGGLTQDSAGLMYGCANGTYTGSNGAIFSITTTGVFSVVYTFTGDEDGFGPVGPVALDSSGNLYGVTNNGTATGAGSPVFKITSKGKDTTIYTIGSEGEVAGLAVDKSGNIFGEYSGGGSSNQGMIYELTKSK